MMDLVVRTSAIYGIAVLGEVGGTYLYWKWLRAGAPAWYGFAGMLALVCYAVVQTYQPESRYGRVYAAYAAVFLVGATLWGWVVDRQTPDRFDIIGALLALTGMAVIMWGRRLFP